MEEDADAAYFRALEQQNVFLNEKQLEAVRTTEYLFLHWLVLEAGKHLF